MLSFDHLDDAGERWRYSTITTSFALNHDTVNGLRVFPARMLDVSPPFRAFQQRMQAGPADDEPTHASAPPH